MNLLAQRKQERPDDGVVDVYLADVKYGDSAEAVRYSRAPGYFEVAKAALREMHRQVGDLEVGPDGLLRDITDAAYGAQEEQAAFAAGTASSQEFAEELYTTCMQTGGDMDTILGRRS